MAEIPVDEVGPVFAQIKAGEEPAWLVLSIDAENKKKVNLTGVGRCGLKHMKRYLVEDQIQFFVFRCYACGAGIRQMQLVCGVWRGPSSNLKAKMALSNIRAPVLAFFDGCKDMEMTAWEDVSDGVVAEKLSAGRAGFKPTHFEFGTGNEEDLEYDELQALEEERRRKEEEERIAAEEAARIAAEAAAEAERVRKIEEERQRRLRLLPPRAEAKPKRVPREPVLEGVDLSELTERFAAEAMCDVEDTLAWVVCSVTEENPRKVVVAATGSGGTDELAAHLSDSEIQFGAFRAAAIERKGQKLSIRSKLITFWWSGAGVTTRTKRENTEIRSALSRYFEAPTLELRVNGDRADFTPERIEPELRKHVAATEFRFGAYDRDSQANDYIAQLVALGLHEPVLEGGVEAYGGPKGPGAYHARPAEEEEVPAVGGAGAAPAEDC